MMIVGSSIDVGGDAVRTVLTRWGDGPHTILIDTDYYIGWIDHYGGDIDCFIDYIIIDIDRFDI